MDPTASDPEPAPATAQHSILDDLPAPVRVIDSEGRGIYFNRAWFLVTGRSWEEERGLGWQQSIHPDDRPRFLERLVLAMAEKQPFDLEYRLRQKDEVYRRINDRGNPTEGGYVSLCVEALPSSAIVRDMSGGTSEEAVTEAQRSRELIAKANENLEQRVEERTAELERTYTVIKDRAMQQGSVAHLGQRALSGASLQELCDEAMQLVRSTLKVDLCSVLEVASDSLTLKVKSSAGWPRDAATHSVSVGYQSQAGYTLLTGEPVIVQDMATETRFQISDPARSIGAVSGITVIIQSGNQPFGVLAAMSTHARAFTQDDAHFLQSIAIVLTAAIDRKSAEERIRAAQAQAEAANRAKSVFLSRMSHELRTPLNAILGFSELLAHDDPTPRQAESLFHIARGGQHLLALINEVLDIARIEVGHFTIVPAATELSPLLAAALDLIRPEADRLQIELRFQAETVSEYVLADRKRCLQILSNLLSNAVKFNRPGGSVTVAAETSGANTVRISVTDTGPGIPPEKMGDLFVPFARLGAESTDVEGAGVGLALSQRIATAMHGTLGVESTSGVGCTFWLELPHAPEPELEPFPKNLMDIFEETNPPGSITVLYVEDLEVNIRLVERILQHRPHYKFLSCTRGEHAIEMARANLPNLILLDLNLPDIRGDELLRRLKLEADLKEIPVIMISAEIQEDRIARLMAMGAAGYLCKPYKVNEFLALVEKCAG